MEAYIFELLKEYTYQPLIVYSLVVFVMFLSSFGLPIPEEISIVSLGLLAYVGSRPDIYPPPYEGAPHVHVVPAMIVCSMSILLSDFLVYSMGRYFGPSLFSTSWFQKMVPEKKLKIVKTWTRRYGRFVPGLFRLIPGVRFPGHLLCGALGIKPINFLSVDGAVVLIVVPTQIFLISYYGESVIDFMKRFQLMLGILGAFILLYLIKAAYRILKTSS